MKHFKDPQTTEVYAFEADGSQDAFIAPNLVQITDEEADAIRTTSAPPAPIPDLSFAQLLIGLVTEAWITEAEGDAWLAGTLPTAVLLVIDGLPSDQRFAAKARALRPSQVLRSDPLVAAMGAAAGKTSAEIDTFFQTYAGV